jgi:hypothetical protein
VLLVWSHHGLYRNGVILARRYELTVPAYRRFRDDARDWVKRLVAPKKWRAGRVWAKHRWDDTIGSWQDRCDAWAQASELQNPAERKPRATVPQLWEEYLSMGTRPSRYWRVLPRALLRMALGFGVLWVSGLPLRPFRGPLSDVIDAVLLFSSVAAVLVLTFYVLDAVRLCEVFCRELAGRKTPWHNGPKKRLGARLGVEPDHTEELLDVRLIADLTQAVGTLIFWPFIAVTLMVISRASWFDRWEWPIPLVSLFVFTLGFAGWGAYAMQRTAARARRDLLDHLSAELIRSKGAGGSSERAAQIELSMKEIEETRRGAFAPLMENPLVGALSLAISGTGLVSILQLFGAHG